MKTPYALDEGPVVNLPDDEIWVRSSDDVRKTANKILAKLSESELEPQYIDVACIGPASVNQAIKAIAVARSTVADVQLDLVVKPYFSTIEDEQMQVRTRIILRVTYGEIDG